jgi:hypothetical protein
MQRTVHALPVLVDGRLHNSQRSRLRMAHALSRGTTRFAQKPIAPLQ